MTEIAHDEVHLWEIALSLRDEDLADVAQLLSDDERAYADEFRDPHAQRQFLISRGVLRRLLSRYLGGEPRDLRFGIEGDGKPVLAGTHPFQFNLSHSGSLVLYAVSATRAVGVDVEQLRPIPRALELAHRFLSAEEEQAVTVAAADRRDHEFLSMWVRREAYAKARGTSVWRALESHRRDANDEYAVKFLDYSDHYVAAVAATGHDWRIVRCGEFREE